MLESLITQMVKQEGVTEQLKAEQPMEWVGRMNNIRSRAEEIVMEEVINTLLQNSRWYDHTDHTSGYCRLETYLSRSKVLTDSMKYYIFLIRIVCSLSCIDGL